MKTLILNICELAGLLYGTVIEAADKKAKVVFISVKSSHCQLAHEHRAGNMIVAKRLNNSVPLGTR